jgi:prepilin-type N-terminal cleavage/methylation domain-containing protein
MRNIRKTNDRGFTMLEMMILIVIIGILASIAAPSFFNWIPQMKLKNDARTNLNSLRQARAQAVAKNGQYGVYFDQENKQLYLFKDCDNPSGSTYTPGLDSLVQAPITFDDDVVISSCTFISNTVIFYPNGSASNSGLISLQNSSGGTIYSVDVLASTGRVKMTRSSDSDRQG